MAREKTILGKQNVVGVGIGKKIVDGEVTGELAIRVYVEKKIAESRLTAKAIIPKTIDDVTTDVIAIGKIWFQGQRDKNRPTLGGDSAGSCHSLKFGYIMAGTMGVSLIDRTDGKEVMLSNNHVFADCDSSTEKRAKTGDSIVQPGTLDGGNCSTDVIGTLKRWVPFNTTGDNEVDAAIADLKNPDDAKECIIGCNVGRVNGYHALTDADVGLEVQKCGRTTAYTTGEVTDTDATVIVGYKVLTPTGSVEKSFTFINQVMLTGMSDGGDSGSLILDMNEKAVGLLFAGSGIVTVANRIEKVLSILNIEFCPQIHCILGGPGCLKSGPACQKGGPKYTCLAGGPISLCRIGGPNIRCSISGPYNRVFECPGPFMDLCHGGPDIVIGCGGGPAFDVFDPKRPVFDPDKWVFIKGDRIPEAMKKSFATMLNKMILEK